MAKSMEKEPFCGRTTVVTKDSLSRTISMDSVNTFGRMAELIKANGRTTKWMEKEFLRG